MTIARYEILTGEHAGEIHDGEGCNARPYPNCPVEMISYAEHGDGVWFPSLGMRMKKDFHNPNYRNLVVAFDKYGSEIFIGDTIIASVKSSACVVRVVKFGKEYHAGCGWMQRRMLVEDVETGARVTINYPSYTIKIDNVANFI